MGETRSTAWRGVIARFWSLAALPTGRMPGTMSTKSGPHCLRRAAISSGEQNTPSRPRGGEVGRREDHAVEAAGMRRGRQSQDLVRRIGIDAGRLEVRAIERGQY